MLKANITWNSLNKNGFPADKVLFAGVVNGKNIWRNHYEKTIKLLNGLNTKAQVILSSSASLLHVPYSAADETKVPSDVKQHLAFAIEKLDEIKELDNIYRDEADGKAALEKNDTLFRSVKHPFNEAVRDRIAGLTESDYTRLPERAEREKIQKKEFNLPILPTTTIGSFPQTKDVRQNRSKLRKGEITKEQYDKFNEDKIRRIVKIQEEIGLDVLVHGEYERNDMVEYFGEKLDGFVFTQNGWVQSYGTRGVKPPIIWGDISRTAPITVAASVFAKNLTDKPMKGMLTGPVTIFNWSFPREDVTPKNQLLKLPWLFKMKSLIWKSMTSRLFKSMNLHYEKICHLENPTGILNTWIGQFRHSDLFTVKFRQVPKFIPICATANLAILLKPLML